MTKSSIFHQSLHAKISQFLHNGYRLKYKRKDTLKSQRPRKLFPKLILMHGAKIGPQITKISLQWSFILIGVCSEKHCLMISAEMCKLRKRRNGSRVMVLSVQLWNI